MQSVTRAILMGVLSIAGTGPVWVAPAEAQGLGARDSLGGYGGSTSSLDSGMSMGGPAIPYGGNFGGFMPSRMGGTGSLSFQSRGTPSLGSVRSSFNLSSMSRGMGSMPSGMGASARPLPTIGATGMGGGGGMPMSGGGGRGVMPPSFAYPFRQPPSLIGTSSAGMGMSM